jgi:multicomponent Na+:H+ antiporter subunit D
MWLGAVALVVGLLTLLSMSKIWLGAFWKPAPEPRGHVHIPMAMLAPIAGLGAITVAIGLMAQPLVTYSQQTAAELSDRERYIGLVLSPGNANATQVADDTSPPAPRDAGDGPRASSYTEGR